MFCNFFHFIRTCCNCQADLVLIKMGLYWPNFSLVFFIHLFLFAGVYCIVPVMGVVPLNSVDPLTGRVPVTNVQKTNKQTTTTLSGSGSSPYAVEYSLTVTISREPTSFFVISLPFKCIR